MKIKVVDLPKGARFSYDEKPNSDIFVLLESHGDGLIASWVRNGIRVDQSPRQEFFCITDDENPNIDKIEVYWKD